MLIQWCLDDRGLVFPSTHTDRARYGRSSKRWIPRLASLLLLLLSPLAPAGGTENPLAAFAPNPFTLTKGKGVEVCDAYLERINTARFESTPLCGRPENAAISGFSRLNRVPMSDEKLYTVITNLLDFAMHGDALRTEKERVSLLSSCDTPQKKKLCDYFRSEKAKAEAKGEQWREAWSLQGLRTDSGRVAWTYEPAIDIDNDGAADPLLLFRDGPCGGLNWRNVTDVSPTYAYIMSPDYRHIDEKRTALIFGHPFPKWPGANSDRFRFIGTEVGIFEYNGTYYFDTFFTSWSDFENKRQLAKALAATLGVFERRGNKTRQVCEYRWRK
jgi:hypothetical protein